MAIKTKEEIVARLQDLQNDKLSQKAQLEKMTQLLGDLVETTFSMKSETAGKQESSEDVYDEADMMTYESYATNYGLESGTTTANEVNGQFTVTNVALGNGITLKEGTTSNLLGIINKGGNEIGYQGAGDMSFDNGGVTMLRVNSSGTVVTNSLNVVRVNTANATGGGITLGDSGDITTLNDGYCSMRFTGGVRIYSAKSGGVSNIQLQANGNIVASGNITAFSDAKLKTNIKGYENGLAKVMGLKPVSYDRTDTNVKNEVGFIAQQVRNIEPNLVLGEEEGNLSLDYSRVVVLLTKALQEQQMQIEGLQQKIQDLDPS